MKAHNSIKNMPESEQPYERLMKFGVEALSDAELLSVIIKSGTKECNSLDIARNLLRDRHKNLMNLYDYSLEELTRFSGIGKVKAMQLKAVCELSKRISRANIGYTLKMNNPRDLAAYYMEQIRHCKNERLICAYFDVKSRFLGDKFISKGSLSSSVVDISSVMRTALEKNASKIVLLHNHPSGDCTPSKDDIAVTDRLAEGSRIFSIELCDHIIIGDNEYYSFYENKII